MTITHGFELLRTETVAELNIQAKIYRHVQTGAQLLSMQNDDENKVFGVTFRTPPEDSTGIAHILEHIVLAGSRKYPLKEPFVQLIKSSLNTFLNAMTYPDRTAYPVASTNLKDFYNLIDVYLDAVFHPLLTPFHLYQEGWRYEVEQPGAVLTYKGVVFNEMKGAYSSPDALLYRYSKQTLFPDNAYGLDSGGDPTQIPNLTYEQLKHFHATYYHPSNARIYFYGDDEPAARLRLLDEYLREFQPLATNGEVTLQRSFAEAKRFTFSYGVDVGTDTAKKMMVQINWLLPENSNPALLMGLDLLSDAILSSQASPLRKALVDSGLGEDVTGGGLGAGLRQMTFAVGMKGVAEADVVKVEQLILATLHKLANEGIEAEMVEAALNTTEFALRENNTGSFPRGLSLMMRALTTWLYDGDPLTPLGYETALTTLKANLADPTYLQQLIRIHLLENTHRTTVVLQPDPQYNQQLVDEEKARLTAIQAQMTAVDLQQVEEMAQELKRRQETPDAPEALAALPTLLLTDLDKFNKPIPLEVTSASGGQLLYHDLFTNGIVYLDLGFNLQAVPQELLPYVHLFGRSLTEMGTEREDFVKLAQRIGRKTGGIGHSTMLSSRNSTEESCAWFIVRGKATMPQVHELLDLLRDILLTVKLDNQERFRQIVTKVRARSEAGLVPSGSGVVNNRLRAAFSKASWASEEMGGINYLFFLRQLEKAIESDWPGVLRNLEAVRQHLVNRTGMIANVTLDAANWAKFEPQLQDFLTSLPTNGAAQSQWTPAYNHAHEGLTIPAQVNYVGKGTNIYQLGYQYHGSINAITNFIRTEWLWEQVRMKGGAYGASCGFRRRSGVFTFTSYRDPNLLDTLAVYDQTANALRNAHLSDDEVTKNIIGAIGDIDGYQLPDAKGYTSMLHYLLGDTEENLQQIRDEVLSTTPRHFREFADVLEGVARAGRVVVMGSAGAVESANASQGNWLKVQKVL